MFATFEEVPVLELGFENTLSSTKGDLGGIGLRHPVRRITKLIDEAVIGLCPADWQIAEVLLLLANAQRCNMLMKC